MNSWKQMLLRYWQIVVRGFRTVDHVLRRSQSLSSLEEGVSQTEPLAEPLTEHDGGFLPLKRVVIMALCCGPLYGAAMGSYAWVVGDKTFQAQIPQLIYSGAKVPLLIGMTVLISLPSFFVVNTLFGLRDDFRDALRAIVSAQAGLSAILVSLFPLTLFCYVSLAASSVSYQFAVLFNAAMFGIASVSAQALLRGYYQRLIERNQRHVWMIRFWIFIYAFVGIQAAFVMRPFIGNPNLQPSFFREDSLGNAYVEVFRMTWNVLREWIF